MRPRLSSRRSRGGARPPRAAVLGPRDPVHLVPTWGVRRATKQPLSQVKPYTSCPDVNPGTAMPTQPSSHLSKIWERALHPQGLPEAVCGLDRHRCHLPRAPEGEEPPLRLPGGKAGLELATPVSQPKGQGQEHTAHFSAWGTEPVRVTGGTLSTGVCQTLF